uniref:DNA binding HTH domain-containing protein n=1 Tax=Micrococcus phage Kurnik TaxID=3092208 RepID=A0AAU6R667_9CAUD
MTEDVMTHGNQSAVARRLGISRQAVAKLIKNRERTGAPEPGEDGLYDLHAFAVWYVEDFKPTSGPKVGIRAVEEP